MNNAAQRVVIPSAARDLSARTAEIPRLRLGMTPMVFGDAKKIIEDIVKASAH